MAEQDLFNDLIATYRDLNKRVRSLPEDRLKLTSGQGKSVREIISQLRDSEMHFSQSLKDAASGLR